jgi:PAN domain
MLGVTDGRLQFSKHRVAPLPDADERTCADACADDVDCGGMAVGPTASGNKECRLASLEAARNATLLPEHGWRSASKVERADKAGASREKFVFADGVKPIHGYDVPQGAKTTDQLLADCTAACEKDPRCRAASVRNPGSGKGRCDLWDESSLTGLRRVPDPDGEHAGAVITPKPAEAPKPERYTFGAGVKPMRVRETPASQTASDSLEECAKECEEDEFCRAATTYATGKGKGKCSLWNAAALKTLKREADSSGRYGGAVIPEKTTVSASGPGFEPEREIAMIKDTPAAAMLAACRKECLASKKCGVIALNRKDDGTGTCYLGQPQELKPQTGSDAHWAREVVNAADPAAPPPLVPAGSKDRLEHFSGARQAAPAAPAAPAQDTVGWFSGTGVFETPAAGSRPAFAPYTGPVDSTSMRNVGRVEYDVAPADLMPLQYEHRKNTLSTPQSMLIVAAMLLAVILVLWMFVFFLQGSGVTVDRIKGMYQGVKGAFKSPDSAKGASHFIAGVRAAAGR